LDDECGLAELDQRASYPHCERFCRVELVVCVRWLADCEFGLVVLGEREGFPYFCGSWFPRRSRSVLQCGFVTAVC
jgi:hypothetical protein